MMANKGRPGIFYGWWIVLAATVSNVLSGGFSLYGFGLFVMPLVNEFGWSRAAISAAMSFSSIEGGLLSPIAGFLIDKFGPRKMMFFGITLMGIGFILLGRVDSLLVFYLVFLFKAAGSSVGSFRACLVAITNWFIKKRGTALGIAQSGLSVGGTLVPLLALLMIQYGWRPTAALLGLIMLIVGLPLALVVRHRPEQYGYLPDGEIKETSPVGKQPKVAMAGHSASSGSAKKEETREVNFTPRQALRTRVFWLLAAIFGLRLTVTTAVVIHQIPFLIDIGATPQLAATMLGGIAMLSVVGKIGFGRLADIMEKRYVSVITLAMMTLGLFILASARTWWQVIPFIIIYAPAYGGAATLMNAIRGEYFGRQHFGTIMGLMDLVQIFGTVLGPVFAGWVFDVTGSYRIAFLSFTVTMAITLVLMLIARRPVLAENQARTA
ncbi:MAG: hypothetical protein HW402_793 [Dehalococcoidales bacterium]|nr:hypothetical protein [Dehalococcoidales bacterium]